MSRPMRVMPMPAADDPAPDDRPAADPVATDPSAADPIAADPVADAPARAPRGATRVLAAILADLRTNADANPALRHADRNDGADDAPDDSKGPHGRLGDIVDRLDERAYGFLILLLALPCCLPFVYLLPQIVALPMLALAAQMAAGRRHPWLPRAMRERRFSIPAFETVLARAARYVGFVERFASPRLKPVTSHGGARLIGALLLVPTASILVPLPSTNTVPGIGVAIAALGLIERDGVLVMIGLIIGFAWVALLAVLGFEAASLIRAWLSTLI